LALPVEYYDEERYYKDVGSRWIGWGSSGESGTGNILPSANPTGVAGGTAPPGSTPPSGSGRE
jgi:outer membrane protein